MPDVQSSVLRVYCLCGQKMRVSEKMYGLPGKCIACRQKIRIPRKEDVPEGVSDIFLKDHPELVRGPLKTAARAPAERDARKAMAKAGAAPVDGEESTPNTELDLADSPPPPDVPEPPKARRPGRGSLPLDELPMLQVLCSLDYKFTRQLETLQPNSHEDEVLIAELEGHRERARKLRSQLDDQLHQRLMETAIELTNTQEKLAQARLAARVGEMNWNDYSAEVHRLRARRDRLERRQQNLRGWLAAQDPYLAGGLRDLSVESMPEEGFTVSLPAELDEETPQLTSLIEALRGALERRTQARQRAVEVQNMAERDGSREVAELRKECEQERLLARAGVAFAHDRLQQLKKDYASDNETANAILAGARDKLRMDALTRPNYDAMEKVLVRAKRDIARALAIVDRALGANAPDDVPHPHGTFLQRLGVGGRRNSPDLLVAYAAAVALALSIFTPSLGAASLVSAALNLRADGGLAAWLFLLPLGLAGAAAGATRIGKLGPRGLVYLASSFAGLVVTAYLIHEAAYSLDPIAARFRSGASWYLLPCVVLSLAGIAALFAASVLAMWPEPKLRPWPVAGGALGVAAAFMISTNIFGAFHPEPRLEVSLAPGDTGEGSVRVRNDGGRAIRLLDRQPDARASYLFLIERRRGTTSFEEARGVGPLWEGSPAATNGILYTVAPGGAETIPFVLPSGDYRAVLYPPRPEVPVVAVFSIRPVVAPEQQSNAPLLSVPPGQVARETPAIAPAPGGSPVGGLVGGEPAPAEEMAPEAASADIESADAAAGDTALDGAPTAELVGVVTTEGQEPRFSLRLRYPDGGDERILASAGEKVWGEWTISEYNTEQPSVTLDDGARLVIVRRRVEVPLGAEAPATR